MTARVYVNLPEGTYITTRPVQIPQLLSIVPPGIYIGHRSLCLPIVTYHYYVFFSYHYPILCYIYIYIWKFPKASVPQIIHLSRTFQ